ncbi:MAG: hypothetical protein CVV14_04150 [Gammaproteobacteria bacterium HGW-Gammaproteobacteria-4]|jgi:4'-phosphopantetheinyl transferase|nr:MAG: hypothetical protein CVV14_04150 [Gammaproteobacteria bacterium HGW-Gammaproteobacteria-4]
MRTLETASVDALVARIGSSTVGFPANGGSGPPVPKARVLLIEVARWRAALPAAASLLDAEESARVARKRFVRDREMLTLAYAVHRLWLAACLRCEPAAVPLIRDERGCPQVPGTPLHTSLSHSGSAIAIALSVAGVIGVDIEPASRAHGMLDLAERICHPAELQVLAALPHQTRESALLRLWVRKEAWLKAVGVGLAWDMSAFEAPADAPVVFTNNIKYDLQITDIKEVYGWCVSLAMAPDVALEWSWLEPA